MRSRGWPGGPATVRTPTAGGQAVLRKRSQLPEYRFPPLLPSRSTANSSTLKVGSGSTTIDGDTLVKCPRSYELPGDTVQNAADLCSQLFAAVRFAEKLYSSIEAAIVDNGVFGITGSEQDPQLGYDSTARSANCRPLITPGMTTSVNKRSTLPRFREPRALPCRLMQQQPCSRDLRA